MDLKLLRDATRPEHEATEAMVPLMHADLTRPEYVAVLQRFYQVIRAWEAVAASEAPVAYADLVRERSRGAALEADLQFFGAPYSSDPVPDVIQQMHGVIDGGETGSDERSSRFLGAMYVVEGSTLGGQYIASHVGTVLGLEDGLGNSFFRGYGAATIPNWREFQQALREIPEAQSQAAIAAAKAMFGVFGRTLSTLSPTEYKLAASGRNDALGEAASAAVQAS